MIFMEFRLWREDREKWDLSGYVFDERENWPETGGQ